MGEREIEFIKNVLVGTVLFVAFLYTVTKTTSCAKFQSCMEQSYMGSDGKEALHCADITKDPMWEGPIR